MRVDKKNRKSLGVYTLYEINGVNLTNLINKLNRAGVPVFNVKLIGEKRLRLSVNISEKEKFFAIVNELCYTVKVIKVYGFCYPLFFLKKNVGFSVGIALFFIVCFIFNSFVFKIEIKGSASIYEREIMSTLDDMGVKTFSNFHDYNLKEIENNILSKTDKITFVSAEKVGNTLRIFAVKKSEPKTPVSDNVSQLFSPKNGIVESIRVYRGTPTVKAGDSVLEGSLLVDGKVPINDGFLSVNVLATVTIISEFKYEYVSEFDKEEDIALLLARETLNKETVSYKIDKKENGGKYFYNVYLSYKIKITSI